MTNFEMEITKNMATYGITNPAWLEENILIYRDKSRKLVVELSDSEDAESVEEAVNYVKALADGPVFVYGFLPSNSGDAIVANYESLDRLLDWFFTKNESLGNTALYWDEARDFDSATSVPTDYDGPLPPATKELFESKIRRELVETGVTEQVAWGEWRVILTTRDEILNAMEEGK
jgi:hypothetical protein